MKTLRSLVLWTLGLSHFALAAGLLCLALLVAPARRLFGLASWICRNQLRLMGCRLEVFGRHHVPTDRAVLYLGNHQSLLDVFAIGGALPSHAIGLEAASHFRYPLWGRVTRAWGNLPLAEGDISLAREVIDNAAQVLRRGTNVIMLPEGHRTRTGAFREFKKGAFHLAFGAKADIVPFLLDGVYEFKNVHSWQLDPRPIHVVFGPMIPCEEYREMSVEDLRDEVFRRLERMKADLGTLAG